MVKKTQAPIRVALVDAHPVVRTGLEVSLGRNPRVTIVWIAPNVEAFPESIPSPPDVVVMDVRPLSKETREIRRRFPDAKLVLFAGIVSREGARQAAEGGIHAYLPKSAPVEDLVKAIETVHGGGFYFSPKESRDEAPREGPEAGKRTSLSGLTRRERQVLKLVAEGYTSRDIADLLHVSVRTVDSHREHIAQKLGIHTVAGFTRFAIAHGLVEPT